MSGLSTGINADRLVRSRGVEHICSLHLSRAVHLAVIVRGSARSLIAYRVGVCRVYLAQRLGPGIIPTYA